MTNDIIAWIAPIIAALFTCAGQLWLNRKFKHADEKRDQARADIDAKRKSEAEWRNDVDRLMQEQSSALRSVADDRVEWYTWREQIISQLSNQDDRIDAILKAQCGQTRSDIIHKCHRYLDDLGRASIEEKEALHAEHEEYTAMCEANNIINHFVDGLVSRVMELPEREV